MSAELSDSGLQFGRYRLKRRLATGGMGEIFLAEMDGAAGIKKTVVIKRILPHLARDPKFVERFLDEGRLVAQLSHSNLVPIFDIGIFQGQYFLAMEHVDGVDLDALIRHENKAGRNFPLTAALHVMNMVARALDYVHTRLGEDGQNLRIVHRDISPQNIMISMSGEVKILDFGIARARTRHVQSLPGFVAGKIPYMSPEQLKGEEASPLCDVYGLGTVVYQLLSGRLPHSASTDAELIRAIQNDSAKPIEECTPGIPEDIARLINSCITKNVEARPSSAADLRKELTEAIKRLSIGSGDSELQKITADFNTTPPETNSFDDLLVQQLDGAFEAMTDSLAGAMRRSTQNLEIELPPRQTGLQDTDEPKEELLQTPPRITSELEVTNSDQERKGFKRWLFLATTIGVALGLGLMILLQRAESPPPELRPLPEPTAAIDPLPVPVSEKPEESPTEVNSSPKEELSKEAVPPTPATPAKDITPAKPRSARIYVKRIKTIPPNADIFLGKKKIGTGSASLRGPKNRVFALEIRSPGYETKKIRVKSDDQRKREVILEKLKEGTVAFRFTPANAQVFIDGQAYPTKGNNRIEAKLKAGKHVLSLTDPQGNTTKRIPFELNDQQRLVLGTIDLREP